jgi:predicted ester cyclase
MWLGIWAAFPDLHIDHGDLRYGDDHVFVEVRLTGTQRADWAGIPATGRSLDTRMACLYEFEDDQLVCERVYMDLRIAPVNSPHEPSTTPSECYATRSCTASGNGRS